MGEGFVIFILFCFFVIFEEFFFCQSVHWKSRQSNRLTVPRDHPSFLPLLSLSVFTCVFFFLNFCLLCLSIFLLFLFSFFLSLSLSHSHTHTHTHAFCVFQTYFLLIVAFWFYLSVQSLSFATLYLFVFCFFLFFSLTFSLMCLFMFLYHLLSYILFLSCSIFLSQVKNTSSFFLHFFFFISKRFYLSFLTISISV